MLPRGVHERLSDHLRRVRDVHARDLAAGFGRVVAAGGAGAQVSERGPGREDDDDLYARDRSWAARRAKSDPPPAIAANLAAIRRDRRGLPSRNRFAHCASRGCLTIARDLTRSRQRPLAVTRAWPLT